MPTGVIIDSLSVVIGGIIGGAVGNHLSESFKKNMQMIFGVASFVLGIYAVAPMKNLAAVIFSVIIGTAFGLLIHLGRGVEAGGAAMQRGISRFISNSGSSLEPEEFNVQLLTIIVLFCASGTGIFGSILNGFTGNPSILVAKSILDLFTALFFATELGYVVSMIAIPQFIFFVILFFLGKWLYPMTTPTMILDFEAAGGVLMLATGFRMLKLKMFPTADMIPALIFIFPLSWFWTNVINVILK